MGRSEEIHRRLADLRDRLGARAAGAWKVSGDRLEQLAFAAAPDLPREVADRFAAATRSVELRRVELAIARAAATGQVVVSIAAELPEDAGSGYWLRAFGARRSVAVPMVGPGGVARVVSVALGLDPDAPSVAELLRRDFEGLEA